MVPSNRQAGLARWRILASEFVICPRDASLSGHGYILTQVAVGP